MSRFVIGQRVRIKFAFWAENRRFEGCEGVVVEIATDYLGTLYGLDISPIERTADEDEGTSLRGWDEDQLEPAIPPGLESQEEVDALYQPEGEAVQA